MVLKLWHFGKWIRNIWKVLKCAVGEGRKILVGPVVWEIKKFNVRGSVHRNNILVYNSNKMHKSQGLFNLTTALHVSSVTITHLQEHKTTVTTASGNRYTVFSAAIVEELELQLFHDSSRQQYGVTVTRCCSYSCFVLLKMGDSDTRNMYSSCQIK